MSGTTTRVEADGAFVINKPKAITSMDVVRAVRRITRVKRVGHAGTLDPIAEGVLPVCLGQATRFMDYLVDSGKTYVGEITFGAATDTYDAEGETTATGDYASLSREQIEEHLQRFTGIVLQRPPMYSAVKHEGQRLYDLARAGVEVERPEREVVVHRLMLREWEPPRAVVEVDCGKGFYMRSLAHDLGEAVGCPAHLSALTRTRVGPVLAGRRADDRAAGSGGGLGGAAGAAGRRAQGGPRAPGARRGRASPAERPAGQPAGLRPVREAPRTPAGVLGGRALPRPRAFQPGGELVEAGEDHGEAGALTVRAGTVGDALGVPRRSAVAPAGE